MSDLQLLNTIAQLVPQGSHVLDLGCGDGALLQQLTRDIFSSRRRHTR